MLKALIKSFSVALMLMLPFASYAGNEFDKQATYTIRISSTSGKEVPLTGSLAQVSNNGYVLTDFGKGNIYTPYETTITAYEVLFSVAPADMLTRIRVEFIDRDDDGNMAGAGLLVYGHQVAGGKGFIATHY